MTHVYGPELAQYRLTINKGGVANAHPATPK